ncbi:hypothetical protein BG910_01355 [Neisseria chenwenguii]|uniref:HTH lysR-type domain-containing protein n=1 Tax=Neisseria chenwenguii TaxID=1853278 RepID=A0A220RZB8_9NEIS|nr:LysR family transcriptional regulator [Neisseria chenwenguii]ASK26571.1 hypothetical protein BG910_01355 [Neisseria chenwenguii]
MNKLEALRLFCAAAETANFRQAARDNGLPPQAVSRAVAFLEQEFGDMLFVRNTRSTQITPFGEQVYRQAKAAVQQTDSVFQEFSLNERVTERGLVRVAMPRLGYSGLLDGVIARLAAYPEIVLDWRCGNELRDTDRSQIDVGIRVGTAQKDDFIVKNIVPLTLVNAAAPSLLACLGEPCDTADLQTRFPLLGHLNENTNSIFSWEFADGSEFVPSQPTFIAPETEHLLAVAKAGRGIGQFALWQVRDEIRSGSLKTVLPKQTVVLENWQLYVYRPNRHRNTARVKRVFDALVGVLEAWLQGD